VSVWGDAHLGAHAVPLELKCPTLWVLAGRSEAYLAETRRLTRTGSFALEVTTEAVTFSSAERPGQHRRACAGLFCDH